MTSGSNKTLLVEWRHRYDSEGEFTVVSSKDEAVKAAAEIMEYYGFTVVDGKLHDGEDDDPDRFVGVEWHKGQPVAFMHVGPCVFLHEASLFSDPHEEPWCFHEVR